MPSALLPVAVGPRMARIGGRRVVSLSPEDGEADDQPEQNQQAELLRTRRERHDLT
jgi:hypothetical protein